MMTEGSEQARFAQYCTVLAAVHKAADGRQLQIQTQPELFGASIIGPLVEAYVLPARGGGFHVDLWRHEADDPYGTITARDLTEAVRLAVTEASAKRAADHDPVRGKFVQRGGRTGPTVV